MLNHQTFLRCSHRTATLLIITSILLFLLLGCASLFRSVGLSPEQAAAQESEFREALAKATTQAVVDIQTGLAEGHDLKTIAARASTAFLWKIIAAAGAGVGVVLNGLLARWLTTEKKINRAIITGIETAGEKGTKEIIHTHALAAGIENALHKRVKALT